MLDALDLSHIPDEPARQAIRQLLNLVEDLKQENRALREDNQRLRDAINQLKGEQGTPAVKDNRPPPPAPDYSSERERHPPQRRGKRGPLKGFHLVKIGRPNAAKPASYACQRFSASGSAETGMTTIDRPYLVKACEG